MFDAEHLRALAAVLDEGSFDAAAARLHVTPSAVSQRIRALEQQVGQVLVVRARPPRPTEAGVVLARLAGQFAVLERDALAALRPQDDERWQRLAIAVNADSLSTWFPAALAGLPAGTLVDLRREDQDQTARLLRDGVVMAAVTADERTVQGCRARPLGAMRYVAVAAPRFVGERLAAGPTAAALDEAPMVAFNRDDALQSRFAQGLVGRSVAAPVHYVPSNAAFVEVLRAGLGWGMAFDAAVADDLASGALVELAPGRPLDVPLYWQHWALRTPALDDLTARVERAAGAALRP